LELIKSGKGAEKLREARAEAIIRARMPRRPSAAQPAAAPASRKREHPKRQTRIALPPSITVGELAEKLGVGSAEVIKSLMTMGILATINQEIDFDAASLVADEHGFDVEPLEQQEAREFGIEDVQDAPEALKPRPPVVTVLGHVDHGKTSLLDAIRQTNVTAQEAGGITQHIGAYQVELGGRKITFIDTPGHEAFTAMRARGAQVTDIAVLVVAADDGVMPQTVEAINHARAAKVPIVVAINKIDKANAQPDRVKQELAQQGLVPEEWGGDTVTVEISALRKQGIQELLEMILLVADMRELKANPDRAAKGTVIEARLDKGRGPVATVLVEKGTLRVGDAIVAGEVSGKVRAMVDDQGKSVDVAGPSMPVEVLGFSEVPQAGDVLHVVPEDKLAKQLAARRSERKRAEEAQGARSVSLEALFGKIREGEVKELNLIIKADVQGSVEALRRSLENLSTDEVKVNVIHSGVGAITESDVMLASTSGAIIIGFQVRPDVNARKMAERDGVDIRLYRIIYDATSDVKSAMEGLLEPEKREVTVGKADVMATFRVPKIGVVAGCKVSEGKISRDSLVRVIRDNVVVHEGRIESLKRFKDDVSEVAAGYECGIGIAGFQDIREGDLIEAFKVEETRREL
jgi:translation initiation factor IF-2